MIDIDDGHVRFRYKDYRADSSQTQKTMTLGAMEFIQRFLLHVLPSGFHRIALTASSAIVTGASTSPNADTCSARRRDPNGSATPRSPPTIGIAMRR